MASERIQLLIDVLTGNSKTQLGQLRSDLSKAEGAFGKAKVGASALGGFLKTNLAFGAAGAATAIGAFAAKSIQAFTDTGRAAGHLRDATGLAAEEASRLAEVGADIGIPVETLATAVGRMNRMAASTPGAFEDIGVALSRAADGSIDVNETFLDTIEAIRQIPDEAQRAEAAQKIFGRGWQQIAELIMTGADGVRAAMESVSDAQVFDDEEIEKAREMHARLEDLQDQFLALQLAAGEFGINFINGVEKINNGIDTVITQTKRLATAEDLRNSIFGSSEVFGAVSDDMQSVADTAAEVTTKVEGMGPPLEYVAGEAWKTAGAHIAHRDAMTDSAAAADNFEARMQGVATSEAYVAEQAAIAAQGIRDLRAEVVSRVEFDVRLRVGTVGARRLVG